MSYLFQIEIFNREHAQVVMERLKVLGFNKENEDQFINWLAIAIERKNVISTSIQVSKSRALTFHSSGLYPGYSYEYGTITLTDLYKTDFINKIKFKGLKLNDEYSAEITEQGVKVHCQLFSFAKILELAEMVKDFQANK